MSLEAIAAEFTRLRLNTEKTLAHPRAAFEAALGEDFEQLPDIVKRAHRAGPVARLKGTAQVEGAQSFVARLVAQLFGFPHAADKLKASVLMRLDADGSEVWERTFGARQWRSRLEPRRPGIVGESFGPFSFDLALVGSREALRMEIIAWRIGGLPLPRVLAPRSAAIESVDADGRFHFDVPIDLPIFGRLVRYQGVLDLLP